jgi:phosphate-selective porin
MKNLKKAIFSLCFTLTLFNLTNTRAQDVIENPLDTLTRTVTNVVDEITKMKRLKITGYIQPQFQYVDSAGAPSFAGGDFVNGTSKYFSRFMMRRGRFKFTYAFENVEMVINTDATEKGIFMRETFVKVTDKKLEIFSLTAGLLQDQFGFELNQSSGIRETPERARYNQTLFPVERDLGIFGSVVLPKWSKFYGLKLDLAVMNGVGGVNPEFDSHKDLTGRLQYAKTTINEKIAIAFGVSYYHGGYRAGTNKDYDFAVLKNGDKGFAFASDTSNYNRIAKREYMGADFQGSIDWMVGITTIRAEYITGQHPGTDKTNRSPLGAPTASLYHRTFNGAYFYFIQNIGLTRFQIVAKYDWYDPNIKISGKEIGKAGTNTKVADIRFDTYGFGVNYRIATNLKLMAYYDYVINESTMVAGYNNDIKDNVLTIRMQYKY